MSDGWKVLNRKVDDYDVEWNGLKELIGKYWHWFAVHLVASEIFRFLKFKNISLLFFAVGSTACLVMYNWRFYAALMMQTMIFYVTGSYVRKKRYVWLLASFWLFILNALKAESYFEKLTTVLDISENKVHDFLVIFAWFILKNISFNLERINSSEKDEKFAIKNCLGYVFYLPTFHTGPHVIYSRYMQMLDLKTQVDLPQRIKRLVLQIMRFSFWFVITEIGLHFFYIHFIVMSIPLESLNIYALFGLGYIHAQFFNNKYVIQYGTPIAFGEFDGIPMPNTPCCMCRVHKYSDMWKWFDHGLYEFLFKYLYINLTPRHSSIARKICAGFATFFFVYIWHGFYDYILIWSIANCLSILVEKVVYNYIESPAFEKKALVYLKTENNIHRLRAFIGAHVLIPAILSNFYFFGGKDFGSEFFRRTYFNGFFTYFNISSTICLLYPIAEAIKRYEQRNLTPIKNHPE